MDTSSYRRREFVGAGVGAAATLALGVGFWTDVLGNGSGDTKAAPPSGYGPMGRPNGDGVRVPDGFRARRVARGGQRVPASDYTWHRASDGAATFHTEDGGWILVSNSEELSGGAGAMRFGPAGEIRDAYRILDGTTSNCAGGPTPWGTWLSCEEFEQGRVWECDPAGRKKARVHDAMGVFKHEAAAVDPRGRHVYLTEDLADGLLYRFTPRRWPRLDEGLLEAAVVSAGGAVTWKEVPDRRARRTATRHQVKGATAFKRAEGIWFDAGTVYLATTIDSRIHAYDTRRQRIKVLYDGLASPNAPLIRLDNLTASRGRELFVCEDISTDEIHIGVLTEDRRASRFLAVTGPNHAGSELTGIAFSPAGDRLYFSSQRAHHGRGEIFEVSGPFRGRTRRL